MYTNYHHLFDVFTKPKNILFQKHLHTNQSKNQKKLFKTNQFTLNKSSKTNLPKTKQFFKKLNNSSKPTYTQRRNSCKITNPTKLTLVLSFSIITVPHDVVAAFVTFYIFFRTDSFLSFLLKVFKVITAKKFKRNLIFSAGWYFSVDRFETAYEIS